jgi:cytochrome P450
MLQRGGKAMTDANNAASAATDVATPRSSASVFSSWWLQEKAARLGARLAASSDAPWRVGTKVIVARHAHVVEVLNRDLEFIIAPVNETRIDEVNAGTFVLGMDRDADLARERQALYQALDGVDLTAIRNTAAARAQTLAGQAKTELDVVDGYARTVAAETAVALFGVSGPDPRTFKDVVRAIFAHTFLNLGNDPTIRDRAIGAAKLMQAWFADEIAKRRKSGQLGPDMMGQLLRNLPADDDLVRRTLGGMLVGSIDTMATSVAKIITVIGKNAALAASVNAAVDDGDRLAGWCNEALRRWPHNPILLRKCAKDTSLAGTTINKDDDVVLWTHAAMYDAQAFIDPAAMRHDRPARTYLHFGAGLHPCAGRVINAFQIPLLVGALVRRGIKSVGAIQWAGPFPDTLMVTFARGG